MITNFDLRQLRFEALIWKFDVFYSQQRKFWKGNQNDEGEKQTCIDGYWRCSLKFKIYWQLCWEISSN